MNQKSSVPQAISFVSQVLKRRVFDAQNASRPPTTDRVEARIGRKTRFRNPSGNVAADSNPGQRSDEQRAEQRLT